MNQGKGDTENKQEQVQEQQTTDNIDLLTNLIKTNIEEYQRTKDLEYIEYILESLKELLRLIPLQKEYSEKSFT